MTSVWCYTCSKCGREIADSDRLGFDFKRGGWVYDKDSKDWTCDECAEAAKDGSAK